MNPDQLSNALKNELTVYEALFLDLRKQQEAIMDRQTDIVVEVAQRIETHLMAAGSARDSRRQIQRQLAASLSFLEGEEYGNLLPLLPEKSRGEIQRLVDFINQKLAQVQSYARQNQLLLEKSIELSRKVARLSEHRL